MSLDIVRSGVTEVHVSAHVWERGEKLRALGRERVVAAAACAVQPPDLPVGIPGGQRVQHGEDWRRPDPGTDQQYRRLGLVEDEGAARRGDVELVTDAQARVQIAAGAAVL